MSRVIGPDRHDESLGLDSLVGMGDKEPQVELTLSTSSSGNIGLLYYCLTLETMYDLMYQSARNCGNMWARRIYAISSRNPNTGFGSIPSS